MHSSMLLGCIVAACLSTVVSVTQFPDESHPKVDITPLSSWGRIREPRGNDHGKQGPLPDPVMISTSPIRVNGGESSRNQATTQKNPSSGRIKRQVILQDGLQYVVGTQGLIGAAQVQQSQQEYIVHRDPVTGTFFGGTPAPIQFQTVTASPMPQQNQLLVLSQNGDTRATPKGTNKKPSKFLSRSGEHFEHDGDQSIAPSIDISDHFSHEDSHHQHAQENPQPVFHNAQQVQYDQTQLLRALHQQHFQQQQVETQLQARPANHGSENPQTVLLSPSAATILQAHQPNAQFVQVQQQAQLPPVERIYQGQNGQTYIVHQAPPANVAMEGHSSQLNNVVVRPQTYVAGPGGQLFTLPIPVQQARGEHSGEETGSGSSEGDRRDRSGEGSSQEESEHPEERPISAFMRRIMDAFTVRGDATERLGTNIALPVLATTGVFFGLGALAAGWYLSNANREVGILRRTGKPVPPGTHNVQRIRRQVPGPPSEVDQSTFFQTIIQQAIEKQKDQFETADEPQAGLVGDSQGQDKYGGRRPANRHDLVDLDDLHTQTSPHSKLTQRPIQNKDWATGWGPSRHTLNFAKVAIPAVILFGAVIAIGVVIFAWYITGSNREIAFMEPSAYSRRKRDLTSTLTGNGGLERVLMSIHANPYDENGIGDSFSQTDSRSQLGQRFLTSSFREGISKTKLTKTTRKRRTTGSTSHH